MLDFNLNFRTRPCGADFKAEGRASAARPRARREEFVPRFPPFRSVRAYRRRVPRGGLPRWRENRVLLKLRPAAVAKKAREEAAKKGFSAM